jgi:hypothetical protein
MRIVNEGGGFPVSNIASSAYLTAAASIRQQSKTILSGFNSGN